MRGVPAIPRRSPRTPLPPVPTGMLASIGKEDGEMWLGDSPELKRPRYLRSLGAAVALLMGKNPGWQRGTGVPCRALRWHSEDGGCLLAPRAPSTL